MLAGLLSAYLPAGANESADEQGAQGVAVRFMKGSFEHSDQMWADFPALVPGVMVVEDVTSEADVRQYTAAFQAAAASRLAVTSEAEFPEVQAWRRAFTQMGLKPTQYRCASESLLRRFRNERDLPPLHPLVDLCNAASIAFGIPVAAFDIDRITEHLQVRRARGDESFLSFSGESERPETGEVVFVDSAGQAHARRWTHRQGRASAVGDTTTTALIVTEALHQNAREDILSLLQALTVALTATWRAAPVSAVLSADAPTFKY